MINQNVGNSCQLSHCFKEHPGAKNLLTADVMMDPHSRGWKSFPWRPQRILILVILWSLITGIYLTITYSHSCQPSKRNNSISRYIPFYQIWTVGSAFHRSKPLGLGLYLDVEPPYYHNSHLCDIGIYCSSVGEVKIEQLAYMMSRLRISKIH